MSFYMSNRSMYTIDAIRNGLRTASTRYYPSEINIIQNLKQGQLIRFNRINNNSDIVDSIIVFAVNDSICDRVGYKLGNYYYDNPILMQRWCDIEGWDSAFAKAFFDKHKYDELWQFRYSLYPPKYNYSPDVIDQLTPNQVFVFGANQQAKHGAGAARLAFNKFGAIYGQAEGLMGQTYGIITTDLNKLYRPSVDINVVKDSINSFIQFAKNNKELEFLVTEVGCGLAGFTVEEIAPLFKSVLLDGISNVRLPKSFVRQIIINSIESLL